MNIFKVGCNFDKKLIDEIVKENNENKLGNKISELYGSIRQHSALSARPNFRLPDMTETELADYVAYAKKNGLNFNYTLNSINPYGSKQEVAKHENEIRTLIEFLTDIGVYRITVANPMLLEIMKDIKKKPKIELSTIAHIDTLTQIRYYFECYGVTKICVNLNKNRNFVWLEKAAKYCHDNNIELELMANEFCGVGGSDYATHCVYRDSCYICHSTNETKEDTKLLNSYPMQQCTMSRNVNPANWLKVKFIRPEDLCVYNNIGIHNFKLTGRTGSTEYLIKVLHAYMTENWEGTLLGLWKPLESITNDKDETFVKYDLPNKKLSNFIKHWSQCKADCDNEVCGQTCRFCENFYNMQFKTLKGDTK